MSTFAASVDSSASDDKSRWLRGALRSSASVLAVGFLLAGGVANAQDSNTQGTAQDQSEANDVETTTLADDPNVIVVSGIRAALESAAQIKRNADTVVDSITASDIATLPDLSVAEALGRIPGLTVSRFPTGGASPDFPSAEGRGNLIRGLGYVRSEFNGRDAFTANAGRALDWSSIPPELVGAVDVYKNQSADLIEGGISGTINLRTLEPFDRPGRVIVGSFDMTYSDLRKKWSPSGSLTVGDRWDAMDGEFGLLASYSRSLLDSRIHGWQQNSPTPRVLDADGNIPETGFTGENRLNEFAGVDPSRIVGTASGFQMRTNDSDRDRESFYGAAQFRNSELQLTAKFVRVDVDVDSIEHTFEWWPDHDPGAAMGITDLTIDNSFSSDGVALCNGAGGFPSNPGDCETLIPIGGGLMESGFVTNNLDSWTGAYGAPVGGLGIGKQERSRTQDISFNAKWNATDRLFLEFDAHYTKASARFRELWGGTNTYLNWYIDQDLDNPYIEFSIDPRTSFNPGNTRWNGDSEDNRIPQATGTSDFNGTTYQFAADRFQVGKGDLYALKGDLTYDLSDGDNGWFKAVKFGARYAERSQTNSEMALNWGAIAPAWAGGFGVVGTFENPEAGFERVDFSDFFRGGVVGGENTEFIFVNKDLLNSYANFRNYLTSEPQLNPYDGGWVPRGENDGSDFGRPLFRPEDTSDITEKTYNAYGRFDWEHDFANGMTFSGNVGVRYARTEINSAGFLAFRPLNPDEVQPVFGFDPDLCPEGSGADPCVRLRTDDAESRDDPRDFLPEAALYSESAAVPQTVQQSYEYWLPSFNAKLDLNPDMLIRFAYSKGLARPDVQDLRASQEYVVTTNRISYPTVDEDDPLFGIDRGARDITLGDVRVSRGNPYLKPTTAHNFDLSYEWYFDRASYLSVAGFYKDISNIISTGELTLGSVTLDGQEARILYNGPVNQASAKIKGIEFAYQQFYDFLPGILSNFGFQGNFTYIDSSATPPGNGVDADGNGVPDDQTQVFRFGVDNLLGQSKYIANAVAIYQDEKLEARLAYNWRSKYLTTYRDYVTGNPVFNSAAGFLDASLKYKILPQVQLRASIANILDTKSKSQVQVDQAGQMYDRFAFLNDRRIVVGAYLEF